MQMNLKFKAEEVNQYHMGKEQLEDLGHICKKKSTTTITNKVVDYYLSKALIDCIRHHMVILELCQKMEALFRFYLILILFHTITVTCFLAYLGTMVRIPKGNQIVCQISSNQYLLYSLRTQNY